MRSQKARTGNCYIDEYSDSDSDGTSGVAKLGHTGARALATRGCAPPVQALSVPNVNRELVHKGAEIELRSIAIWNNEVSYAL